MTTGTRIGSLPAGFLDVAREAGRRPWLVTLRRTALARALLDRIRAGVVAPSPAPAIRFGVATLAVAGVAVLRWALFAGFAPWFLFTPAVVAAALFLGGGAGLWATLLSTLCAGYVLLGAPPVGALSPLHWVGSGIYAATTAALVGMVVVLREALRDTDAARADLGRSMTATAAREAFLASVMASSTDCIKVLDLDAKLTFMSEGGQRVMEVSDFNAVAGCPWPDLWSGEGHAHALAAVAAAREGRSSEFVERTATMAGNARWWHVAVSPILGPDGRPDRILSVSRDVTPLRESEEDLRLMNGELAHRLKNVLAVVQSVAHQTLRNAADLKVAGVDLSARLVALGTAADVLTGASWRAADLREIAARALAPHGELGARIALDGPDVTLSPSVAVALALALHELATNAAKYGALASEGGTITLAWGVEGTGPSARFWLRWRERGGPPVAPPTRRGFGTNLIERSLRSYFGGTIATDYHPEGLTFSLEGGADAAVWNVGKV